MDISLPSIPAKRYFTIGEVSDLCGVKAYVLRYWEQEFSQLKPMKRRGNRRYYQHHEVVLIRRIRELLYEQGFTISGARNRLVDALAEGTLVDGAPAFGDDAVALLNGELAAAAAPIKSAARAGVKAGAGASRFIVAAGVHGTSIGADHGVAGATSSAASSALLIAPSKAWTMASHPPLAASGAALSSAQVRDELLSIRAIVTL